MDTMALPQKTLAIWERGGLSAPNRHTVVVRRCPTAFGFLHCMALSCATELRDGEGALLKIFIKYFRT